MANLLSKIERLGLEERVQELLRSGVTMGKRIARILREEEGVRISDSAVNRYLAKVRDTIQTDAFKIVREHVSKEVPKDLDALEELEAQLLAWSRETPQDAADRIAAAGLAVEGEVEKWAGFIRSAADAGQRADMVSAIVKTCVGYVLKDARLQNKRVQAMREVVRIIELKLRHAGLLDDETKGRIVVMQHGENSGQPGPKDSGASQVRIRMVKGGGHG